MSGEVIPETVVRDYVEQFNRTDNELYKQFIPNNEAAAFLSANVPRFDCPDKELEEIYYFRWWTYRKQIRQTKAGGFIITAFLPEVGFTGFENSDPCAASHHLHEGRWLHNPEYIDSYIRFFFGGGGGNPRMYSSWIATAILNWSYIVDTDLINSSLLDSLVANFNGWEKDRYDAAKGLFWQYDGWDGMEVSICGKRSAKTDGYRATINSYMIADARSIAAIARRLGKTEIANAFEQKAAVLQKKMLETLWDEEAQFFKVLPRTENGLLCDARELHGYTPWYFNIADEKYATAWRFLMNPKHFYAPYGPTTAEQCHPEFEISYKGHECQWNGPSWPYSTSVTLTGMANMLNNQRQNYISKQDYFDLLKIYARSHHLLKEDGTVVPWIDENLNPFTGDWIARTRLKTWQNGTWSAGKGGEERGKDYNHSTFCDLIITGLIGIRPEGSNQLTVNPLIPKGIWDYFCLDDVQYKGHKLTIIYDKTGKKYKKGAGFRIFVDGKLAAKSKSITKIKTSLQ
ncbi:MAG: hypothetical protein LBR18_09335 [Tannerella sp.]|nr:hypothetical protein [Tannerella sp.]